MFLTKATLLSKICLSIVSFLDWIKIQDAQPYTPPQNPSQGSCRPCSRGCYLCRNYLISTETFTSYHTSQQFSVNKNIDCYSKDVIYLIYNKVCKLSNVGCTTDSLKTRFSNHKSHIKFKKRTCEVSKHFSGCETLHDLDKSSNKAYDLSLETQIEIIAMKRLIFQIM